MANITGQSNVNPQFSLGITAGFLNGQRLPIPLPNRNLLASFKTAGVAADQVNLIYANTLTFVSTVPQTLDLTALLDPLGAAVNFARVRFQAYRINSNTVGAYLILGGAATNEWTGMLGTGSGLKILASTAANDGFFVISAPNTNGYPVTGTSKNLLMTPSAHGFTVDVIIAGCNA
jgi:hypothetical protein